MTITANLKGQLRRSYTALLGFTATFEDSRQRSRSQEMNTSVPALQAHSVDAGVITESVFLCILAIVVIFGNVLVCIAFYRDRKLRTTTNCFLVSLAIADIAVGSFSLPYWIYFRIVMPPTNSVIYQIYITYDIMCGTASIINLVTISLERCLSVTQPAIHRNLSDSTITTSIAGAWIYALTVGSLTHIKNSQGTWYPLFVSIASFFLPLFIILVNYVIIYRIAHRRARKRKSRSLKREIRIAVTLGVVIMAFIVAWLPFFVLLLVSVYCGICRVPKAIYPLVKWMHYSGSMVNPIIYTYRNDEFKRSFLKILCGWREEKPSIHDKLCNNDASYKALCAKCKRSSSNCNCPMESNGSTKALNSETQRHRSSTGQFSSHCDRSWNNGNAGSPTIIGCDNHSDQI
ncbi:Histamine H2 receptor [Exaiptasia diaphana]|nr:Histamine H2 receptor [Exaiptasia diaphana]